MAQDNYSDPVLERNALAAILRDREGVRHLSQLLPKHFTDENLKRLFTLARRLTIDSGVAPTRETLRIELVSRYPKVKEVVEGILVMYDQLSALSIETPVSYLVSKLVDLARVRDVLSSTEQFLKRLDDGNVGEALRGYQEDAFTLQISDPATTVTRGEVIRDFEKRKQVIEDMSKHPEKYRGILTGIDMLDQVTGGLWDGELGFVFGKSGVGKSFLLLEFAFNAYRSGCKVLVIPIEMPLIQWERRFDSRISRIAYEHFKWGTLSSAEMLQWEGRIKVMKEKYTSIGGDIYIAHIPMGCTLGAVRAELEMLIRQGTPADLLIIDYAQLMTPSQQLYSEQGELTAIFRSLKGIAGAYNIPIWTASQAKKEAYKLSYLGMTDVGYAMGSVHVSDLAVGVARSDEHALADRMILSIAKYRDGAYNKPIELNTNLMMAMVNTAWKSE
jgi:replicative DNA helicase